MLQAFVVRGISNMIRLLKGEYLNFLKQENLLTDVLEAVKPISKQVTFGNKSIEELQQLVDNITHEGMLTDAD